MTGEVGPNVQNTAAATARLAALRRHADRRLPAVAGIALGLAGLAFVLPTYVASGPGVELSALVVAAVTGFVVSALARWVSPFVAATVLCLILYVALVHQAFHSGGSEAAALRFGAVLPLVALWVGGSSALAMAVTGAWVFALQAFFWIDRAGFAFPVTATPEDEHWVGVQVASAEAVMCLAIGWAWSVLDRRRERAWERAALDVHRAERADATGRLALGLARRLRGPIGYLLTDVAFARARLREVGTASDVMVDAALGEAHAKLEHLARIVRDVASMPTVTGEPTAVPLDTLELAIDLVREELEARAKLVVQAVALPRVAMSPGVLVQVMLDLLDNAVQGVPSGQAAEHTVSVLLRADGPRWVVLEVSDTGRTMESAELAGLFDVGTPSRAGGVTANMAATWRVVVDHGGTVSARPREQQRGMRFTLRLPVASSGVAASANLLARESESGHRLATEAATTPDRSDATSTAVER